MSDLSEVQRLKKRIEELEAKLLSMDRLNIDASLKQIDSEVHASIQKALKASEEKYRKLFESLQEGIWGIDHHALTTFVNPSMARMLGYTPSEMIGKHLFTFMDENGIKTYQEYLNRRKSGVAEQHEFIFLKKDGSLLYALLETFLLFNDRGDYAGSVASIMDITRRKETDEILKFTQFAIDHAGDAIFWIHPDGRIFYANKSARRSIGYSYEELTSLHVWDIDPEMPRQAWPDHWTDLRQKGTIIMESMHRTRDGRTFLVEITANYLCFAGHEYNCAFARDISERKRAEEEKRQLQAQLGETRKIEAIATLAGGIAHQFNNVLSVVQGCTEMIGMDAPLNKNLSMQLDTIKKAVGRMTKLTTQLLSYAGGGRYKERVFEINDFIEDAIPLIRHRIRPDIKVQTVFLPQPSRIKADPTQIQMVLSEVIFNAAEAIDQLGVIRINTAQKQLEAKRCVGGFVIGPGSFVCISIQDDGRGMAPQTCDRIFEPFYSTKFHGRGLGMAAAYGIVGNHGGWISVDSAQGRGTTVHIHLPLTEEHRKTPAESKHEIIAGKETILLIDNETTVLEVGTRLLEKMGYTVYAAASGQVGLDLYKRMQAKVDVVILDLIMPKLGGGEVFDRLQKIDPQVCVLLSSGYSEDGEAKKVLARGCRGFIQKPFSMENLSKSIRSVLDQPS